MAIADDDQPRRKRGHDLGEDLSTPSLEELAKPNQPAPGPDRRIEDAIRAAKQASASAADAFFKR